MTWSVISMVLLVGAGTGVWLYRSIDLAEPETDGISIPSPDEVDVFPSQIAASRFVPVAALLFLGQVLLGGLLAHYYVERDAFFGLGELLGVDFLSLLPFAMAKTWHIDLAVLWIATLWLGAGQFPAALAVVGALALPVGSLGSVALALPWLGVTGGVASVGLRRLLSRGLRPLPDLAVDAALLYVPVGAVALLLQRAGIDLRFEPIIVLLTVVHYHYAGFVLPLVTGLAGRRFANGGRLVDGVAGRAAAAATLVVVVNLALIAVGITFSPLVEVVAVTLFTVAVAAFALLVLRGVAPSLPPLPRALLSVAALTLVVTMSLALAYGYSAFPATGRLISIGEMVAYHGSLNAVGFALPALLAFRLLDER
jgi:nitric oxide reductase large subunit